MSAPTFSLAKENVDEKKRYKRIWFKPDCVKWIVEGKKTTTFRSRRHEGLYEIDLGSRFKPKPSGIRLRLTPIEETDVFDLVAENYATEGNFNGPQDFQAWLDKVGLTGKMGLGWLHKIEVLEVPK